VPEFRSTDYIDKVFASHAARTIQRDAKKAAQEEGRADESRVWRQSGEKPSLDNTGPVPVQTQQLREDLVIDNVGTNS
jgi:hypothetical protein